MATNLKIRNSGLYRLLLFALCVLAFSQVISGLRAVQFRSQWGASAAEDFYNSRFGLGGLMQDAVIYVNNGYINERTEEIEPKFQYYVTGRRGSFTNAEPGTDIFREFPYSLKIDGNNLYYGEGLKNDMRLDIPARDYPDMVIGLYPDDVAQREEQFAHLRRALIWRPEIVILSSVLFSAAAIELLTVTGRRAAGDIRLLQVDRWPTEILLLALGVLLVPLLVLFYRWLASDLYFYYEPGQDLLFYLILVALFAVLLALALVLVRKMKAGRFRTDAILYRMFSATMQVMRKDAEDLARTEQSFRLALRYVIASAVLVFLWWINYLNDLLAMTLLVIVAILFLYLLRTGMKVSEESVRASVEEQLTAERLKVDLVTNVSHDLNTPLTSIIGYVDLLQDEDMSDSARDYVEILRLKSLRLKGIVSDLFALSKSTSGAMELHRETLDYTVLIRQTLSDLQDTIHNSGREVVHKLPGDPVWVLADGTQLYRVLQNLIDNALRYSKEGTRIFLRLEQSGDTAHLTVKNVSAYPLDFDEEEILSRFVRGDLARTTEGSGLGLAIAKSFTENNKGSFQVFAEEDIFIAMQTLQQVPGPQKIADA